ncbi:MAG: AMP-binding protein [Acidimicrobiales bacterium]
MYAAEHARSHPDQPAFIMGATGEVVTYAEYEARANRLAHLYRDQGLRRGDHVAVFMENNPRFLETEAAADRTGLYYTLINSYLSAEEVAYVLDDCQARILITSTAKREVALEAAGMAGKVERFLMVGGPEEGDGPFDSYEAAVARYPADPVPDEAQGMAMLYSSGTTGRPKGIWRPLPDSPPGVGGPGPLATVWQLREGMTYLSPAPLYHSAPTGGVSLTIRLKGTIVIMERFDPEQFLVLVERYRVTHTQMVPTMFSRLLKLPEEVRRRYDLSSLEGVVHAAAPCPVPVKEAMIEWFGPILLEYYAATEGIGMTVCDSKEWLAHKGTVGRPLIGRLMILDDDRNECPTGAEGTVWFQGDANFEYFNDPDKTAESRDKARGTSTVGDVGRVDEEGYLYLTDRKTYMIISGGVNIYPQETENLLVTHPKVLDAAVIGVPNEDLGEEVKAVVQLMPEVAPGPDLERELIAFCREHLAHFKCPRSVDFTEELPRLPTGKLYKRLLRDRYWGDHTSRIV